MGRGEKADLTDETTMAASARVVPGPAKTIPRSKGSRPWARETAAVAKVVIPEVPKAVVPKGATAMAPTGRARRVTRRAVAAETLRRRSSRA